VKPLLLALLVIIGVFPFKLFCHTDNHKEHFENSITSASAHQDCPFCTIQFYHDYEAEEPFSLQVSIANLTPGAIIHESQQLSWASAFQNKGPPTPFL